MVTAKTTTGYYKIEICYSKKYFMLECGDIDGEFSTPKIIVLSCSEGETLIEKLKSVMEEIKNENSSNTRLSQS